MKKIVDLEYSFPDAENYRRREFKEKFSKSFLIDNYVRDILKPEIRVRHLPGEQCLLQNATLALGITSCCPARQKLNTTTFSQGRRVRSTAQQVTSSGSKK